MCILTGLLISLGQDLLPCTEKKTCKSYVYDL